MKYVVYAIVLALSVPLYSQEIRLDSLWIKMGGYPVMAFSPDSKFLLLGQADGIVNIVEVETGTAVDTITLPKNGYADFGFTPDGKYLVVSERKKITLFSAVTWDSLRESPAILSTGYISFSNDSKYVAVADRATISILDLTENKVVAEITRPTEYKVGNQTVSLNNGRVNFSSDGTLLYGKNAEDFGSWDLTKANTPFVRKMTIGNRAVIGFTPDNRYMIQQSNYIWDLNTKAQVQIEGLESYYSEVRNTFCTTPKGELTVVTQQNRFAAFIDIPKRKMLSVTPLRLAYGIQISPDSMYLAHNYGDGAVFLKKIQWTVSNVETELHTAPTITISPIPGKESLQLYIHLRQASPSFDVKIHDISGKYIETLYSGSVELGEQRYTLDTKSYSSGKYYVVLSNNGSIQSYPFLITK